MSQSEPVIHRAAPADLTIVTAITNAAYSQYVESIGRKPQPMVTDYVPMIAQSQVWLLDQRTQSVGLIVLIDEADYLLIYSVAVHPDHQKQGLGHYLLRWAEQQALEKGYFLIRLYTNALMTENIARYQSIGYHETHRETYLSSTLIHMEKALVQTT